MASLNRAEWEDMWRSIKRIELVVRELASDGASVASVRRVVKQEVATIKAQIQSVIGQME